MKKKKKFKSVMGKIGVAFLLAFFIPLVNVEADTYDLYVDVDNTGVEDGSESHPYNTIGEALDNASEGDEILIKKGIYTERIEIPRGVEVYGESKSDVTIDGENTGTTVKMNHKSKLKQVTVKGGNTGIKVKQEAGVTIKKVRVKDADEDGIFLEGNSKTRKKDKYKRTIRDCTIRDNGAKGMYIQKSRVIIEDSKINDNEEEGIDIRKKVKATIKNNEIEGNGESNIEFKIDDADLKISKNDINNSDINGISAQSYQGERGTIIIKNNDIKKNEHYGLRCSVQKHKPQGGWSGTLTLFGNVYSGNEKANFSSVCGF